jgi:glycosyltransferase involved in cell wall biosynthesis
VTQCRPTTILLLGSFPPQTQGIPGYCGALAQALASCGPVHAIGFKAMYPARLFPGVKDRIDPTSRAPHADNLTVSHALAWYNPIGWLWHAFHTPADRVHIQWWSLPLFPVCLTFALAAKLRRIPLIITVHNVLPHEASPGFLRASRVLYRLADRLIVHTEASREQILQHFPVDPHRVACIPMGVDAPRSGAASKRDARTRIGIDPGRPTLLFFGTIRPYKGLMDLLRAMAIVREKHTSVQLLVAGMPWDPWAPYAEFIDQNGLRERVYTRLDYIPEDQIQDYFSAADLVVLPYTHFDAQSAVGAQVLGAGRPLLVTKTGGLPALVGDDARWIAPPRDPAALAERIAAFLAKPEEAAAVFEAIASEVRAQMSWQASADAHWRIYRDRWKQQENQRA